MKQDQLSGELDAFFISLLEESKGNTADAEGQKDQPKIGFLDRLKTFEAGVRWMMVKAKVEPEDGPNDEFGALRRGYSNSGPRRRGPNTAPPAPRVAGAANGAAR